MEKEFIASLITLFERDLRKLEEEIKLYHDESLLWKIDGEIKNSAGNLCLHLCGNLQHFIGAVLGNTGYQRNRDLEFSAKGVPAEKLIEQIKQTRTDVRSTLEKIDLAILQQEYALKVFDYSMTTLYFLIHLAGHLNYHLGQVNYHRRLNK